MRQIEIPFRISSQQIEIEQPSPAEEQLIESIVNPLAKELGVTPEVEVIRDVELEDVCHT